VTGKNVPENRNSGMITNRCSMANEVSFSRVMAQASMGAAKARAVSTQAGSAATTQAELTAPNAAITARKMAEFISTRIVTNSRCPRNRSAGRSDVAAAAW
jgi:hypothetical protein